MFTLEYNPEGKVWLIETFKPILSPFMYIPSVITILFGFPLLKMHPEVLTYLLISMVSSIVLCLIFYWIDCSRGIYDAKWADEDYRKSFEKYKS
jgi:hypothetical protein